MKYFLRIAFIICSRKSSKGEKSSVNIYFAKFFLLSEKIIVEICNKKEKRKNYFRNSNFLGLYNYIFNFLLDNASVCRACYVAYLYLLTIRRMHPDGEIYVHFFIVNAWVFTKTKENCAFCILNSKDVLEKCLWKCLSLFMIVVALVYVDSQPLSSYLCRSQKFVNLL